MKSNAVRTGLSTFETLFHADFTAWTIIWGIHTVGLSSAVAGACLVDWTSTTRRGNLEGDLPAGWVSPGNLPRPRLDGSSATGGVCGRSSLLSERLAGVIEVTGTDLVRRTLVVDVPVRSTSRRWTTGETDGRLLRALISVSLRRGPHLSSAGRHGDCWRVTAADWPAIGLLLPPASLVPPDVVPFLPLVLLSAGVALQDGGLTDDEARASEKMGVRFLSLALAWDLTLGFELPSGICCRIGSSLLYADFTRDARATARSPAYR